MINVGVYVTATYGVCRYLKTFYLYRNACTQRRINAIDTSGKSNSIGPAVYLLRLLIHQVGFSCLETIVNKHTWLLPPEVQYTEVRKYLCAA